MIQQQKKNRSSLRWMTYESSTMLLDSTAEEKGHNFAEWSMSPQQSSWFNSRRKQISFCWMTYESSAMLLIQQQKKQIITLLNNLRILNNAPDSTAEEQITTLLDDLWTLNNPLVSTAEETHHYAEWPSPQNCSDGKILPATHVGVVTDIHIHLGLIPIPIPHIRADTITHTPVRAETGALIHFRADTSIK